MPFTASAGSQAGLPIQSTTQSVATVSTPILAAGSSISPSGSFYTAGADKILFTISKSGTLQNDSTLELQVTVASGVVEVLKTYTNAQIQTGLADLVEIGTGTQFRWQFRAGTTAAPNGVQIRFRN